MRYDKKIYHSIFTLIMAIVITVAIVVSSYFVIYGANGITLIKNRDDKATAYALAAPATQKGEVVFLGDSITEMCKLDKYYPDVNAINRGISGDDTSGMLKRLNSNVLALSPKTLVILGGTNDLDRNVTPQQIAENIEKIIKLTQENLPNCNIYVQSIYPVNPTRKPTYLNKVYGRNNQNIQTANKLISLVCEQKNCVYIDVNTHLKDGAGNLKKEYSKDGLHLTRKGYEQVSSIVMPYISEAT